MDKVFEKLKQYIELNFQLEMKKKITDNWINPANLYYYKKGDHKSGFVNILGSPNVDEGVDGFVSATNTDTPGVITTSGFDASGTGPGDNLELLVDQLKSQGVEYMLVKGYADPKGTDDYNLKLSKRRAKWVKAYLIEKGWKDEAIATMGFGEVELHEDMAKNRKVAIILINK